MASHAEKDLSCPICTEIFLDPVVLLCKHSFCRGCVKSWWQEKLVNECPSCRERSSSSDPPANSALKEQCKAFILRKRQAAAAAATACCSLHSEKLKLFCLDHQQPVCVVCRDSRAHDNHRFRPIGEAAEDHREELRKTLEPRREKLKVLEQAQVDSDQMAKHIKVQTRHAERQMKEQFQRLHQFLREEEEERTAALREEEKRKSQRLRQASEARGREISALSDTIRAAEKELRAEDVSFLQNFTAAVEALQRRPLLEDPQLPSAALIDLPKHLGNLGFNIWRQMSALVSYTPVILDPNSAHSALQLSDDLSAAGRGEKWTLPKNPERLQRHCGVLGSQGFGRGSGAHSWTVEVGDAEDWVFGVAALEGPSSWPLEDAESGLLEMRHINGELEVVSPFLLNKLNRSGILRRIRVQLDWDKGTLSFSDADTDTHIHTLTHTFNEKVFPYFRSKGKCQMRILPEDATAAFKK